MRFRVLPSGPLLASSKKLASIHFKTAMVVAFNDAAHEQFNVLRLRLSLHVRHDK